MSKVKIEDLKVFPAVARVIGEKQAKIELFKIQGCDCWFCDHPHIDTAFIWRDTPQGGGFWGDICDGINPYDK